MKIALVCNKGEEAARYDQLFGYSSVYSWHLRDALMRAGAEAVLSKDRDLPRLEPCSVAIAISNYAHGWFIANAADIDSATRYLMTDGPTRGLATLDGHKIPGAYIGMGADPAVCYPEQDPGKPVVLFNAYNRDLARGETDNPRHQACVNALEAIAENGAAEVWALNCQLPFKSRLIGQPRKDAASGYVLWLKYMSAVRQCWVFLDSTPKVIELGRVEAAACGASIVAPGYPTSAEDAPEEEGLWALPMCYFGESMDALRDTLTFMCGTFGPEVASMRHKAALGYFSWDLCAERLIKALS